QQADAVDRRSESCRERAAADRGAGGGGGGDERARIRRATRSAAGEIECADSNLRPELRLRANQRGVHDLSGGNSRWQASSKLRRWQICPQAAANSSRPAANRSRCSTRVENSSPSTTPASIAAARSPRASSTAPPSPARGTHGNTTLRPARTSTTQA